MDAWPTPRIRPLRDGEHEPVQAVFAGMSPRSRHQRFHQPTPKLSGSALRLLTDVDDHRHVALVAEVSGPDGPRPIGIARCVAIDDRVAEVAYEVVDDWHGRGVGRQLLTALAVRAEALGYRRLVALVLPGNRAAAALLRSVFADVTQRHVYGAMELTAEMAPAAATANVTATATTLAEFGIAA